MLSTLTPKPVWQIFSEICAIPRPSHHEEQITQYVIDFAAKHAISCQRDNVGNILLTKAATVGLEQAPSICLQAHLDMVPQKNEGTPHNFLVDPIQAYIEGEWVTAKETTLGADNGIGLASALAILSDPNIEHGPLEVLLTASEETGMVGAFGLQAGWLKSHYLINTDSEQEGEIFTGCAGGIDFHASLPIAYAIVPPELNAQLKLSLKGLRGGHSGCDIHLGRGNAIKLLIRFLVEFANDLELRLVDFAGGTLRNAIAREAFVTLSYRKSDEMQLLHLIDHYQAILNNELGHVEPKLNLSVTLLNGVAERVFVKAEQARILAWLNTAPHGVVRMSDQFSGVVETSLNLGIVNIEHGHIHAYFLVRSLVDTAKDAVIASLISHSQLAQAQYQLSGGYPGWQPNNESPLLTLIKQKYRELFDVDAKIMVIHAGLECGLFKKPYPNLDMVSIGPTIVSPHSPDEKVNIASVYRYWELLLASLKAAARLQA